jgi:hypothetical protein
MRWSLAVLLLALPAAAQQEPALRVVSSREILPASFIPVSPARPKAPPMTLLVEQGSGFEAPGRLERMLGKASAIFGPCGVSLGRVRVLTVVWSAQALRELNVEDPYKGPSELRVISDPSIPAERPLGALFGTRSIPSTAAAFNVRSGRLYSGFPGWDRLVNTWWMTWDQENRPARRDEAPSYSITAHELTHLFGDLGHTDAAPNLMTNAETPGAKSGDLDASQCAAVVQLHGLP